MERQSALDCWFMSHPFSNPSSDERQALATGLLAVLLWSSVATGFKLGLSILTPLQLVLLGSSVSTLIFLLVWLFRSRKMRGTSASQTAPSAPAPHTSCRTSVLREALPLAAINPLSYYPLLLTGYERLPAQIAQPLNFTWAIVLALLAVPLLKQPLTRRLLLGICISYAGAVLLVAGGSRAQWFEPDAVGLICIAITTVLWALYWILNTRTSSDPLLMMLLSFALALVPLAALTYWVDGWPALNLQTLAYGLWIGAIEMGFTFLLWQRALRLTRQAARIGQLIFLAPFLGLIPIHYLVGEPILWTSVAGLGVIVCGLLITGRPQD